MGDIAKMTLDELAEYVVTLDGWKQPKLAAFAECDAELNDLEYQIDQCSFGASRDFLYSVFEEFCQTFEKLRPPTSPNLTDPATLGCLLAMVRTRHGAQCHTRYCPDLGWFVDPGTHGPPIAYESVRVGYTKTPIYVGFEEEAHALVAALAKEAS